MNNIIFEMLDNALNQVDGFDYIHYLSIYMELLNDLIFMDEFEYETY